MTTKPNKAQTIYRSLKRRIDDGEFGCGELLPTDLQLAGEFQVCRPTVARAMKRLEAEGYIDRKAGYGTCVRKAAACGGSEKELTLGLIVPGLGETEIFDPICGRIAGLADRYRFHLLWGGGGTSPETGEGDDAVRQAERYAARKVDGVFFAPLELRPDAEARNREILNLLKTAGIPVALLDRDVASPSGSGGYDLVGLNNREAGFVIASHLMERGCRRIGFLTRPNIAGTVYDRLAGAREAVFHAELPADSIRVLNFSGSAEEFADAEAFRALDGLICYNDAVAATLLVELDRRGIRIPGELKICAFDDVKFAALVKVPLTTYRQPCADLAEAAVETMISRIRRPKGAPRAILLRGRLVARASTSVPPSD